MGCETTSCQRYRASKMCHAETTTCTKRGGNTPWRANQTWHYSSALAAGKGEGRGVSVLTRKWGGATASQDWTLGAALASSLAASSVARATCSAIWPCRALATADRRAARAAG
eukprot:4219362-Pyramimonas_sp.AAC.1